MACLVASLSGASDKPMNDAELTKIYIDLPEHWAVGGESLWAKPLGGDLYEVDNIPFYAYGINYKDIVRAAAREANTKPQVEEVVNASGHKTLRFFFAEHVSTDTQHETLHALRQTGLSFERAGERYVAVDVPPHVDYAATCSELDRLEGAGVLEYETCEIRVAGRFDLDGSVSESDA